MFNTLSSLHSNFPTHPVVYVLDLGMTQAQRCELSEIPWIRQRTVEEFVPHWKTSWSWKPYVWLEPDERYVLYFDSANFVVLHPLELWFLSIQKNSYFVISASQPLRDIVPSNYWSLTGVTPITNLSEEAFGAGLFGFDNQSMVRVAIRQVFQLTKEGWTLGCSVNETNRVYDRRVIRDCDCFRADQTLINLALRKHIGTAIHVRNELKYFILEVPCDHVRKAVWYARKRPDSLIFFWTPLNKHSIVFFYNRLSALAVMIPRRFGGKLKRAIGRLYLDLKQNG